MRLDGNLLNQDVYVAAADGLEFEGSGPDRRAHLTDVSHARRTASDQASTGSVRSYACASSATSDTGAFGLELEVDHGAPFGSTIPFAEQQHRS